MTPIECDRLLKLAHEAPMAKIYTTHTGHKFVGVHTQAWAKASRDWMKAMDKLEALKQEASR